LNVYNPREITADSGARVLVSACNFIRANIWKIKTGMLWYEINMLKASRGSGIGKDPLPS